MTTLAHLERTYLHYLAFDDKNNFTQAVLGDLYNAYTADKGIINPEIDRLNKIHVVAAINHLNATNKDEFNTAITAFGNRYLNLDARYASFNKIVNSALSGEREPEVSKPANDVSPDITEIIQKIHNKILNSGEFQAKATNLGFQPNTVANLKSASEAFDKHFAVAKLEAAAKLETAAKLEAAKLEAAQAQPKPVKTNNQQQATAIAVAIAAAMSSMKRK